MHRIDDPTAVPTLPAPRPQGTPGYFTGGSPGSSGFAATIVRYEFMNALQEEISAVIEAAGLTLDKTNNGQLLTALHNMTGIHGVQIFKVPGTFTYTPTPGTRSVDVLLVGGGAGGCGAAACASGQVAIGPGGSAGGHARSRLTSGFAGVTVTVGAGTAGAIGNVLANPGGTSSFGALLSATGGSTSYGNPPSTGLQFFGGSRGGGGAGGNVYTGYGGIGVYGICNPASGCIGGTGGASVMGAGGAPASCGAINLTRNGEDSFSAGGGGGGGACSGAAGAANGGRGGDGVVVVREYA